jgi:hypothetical protein
VIADRVIAHLRKRIRERLEGVRERTSAGRAKDWAEYREWVGEGKAYRVILDEITETMKHYEETEDDDVE